MTDADLLAHYDQLSDTDRAAYLAQLDAEDDARDARLRAPGALAAAATWYASQGIAIFPCMPWDQPANEPEKERGKRPLGRLVPHGLKDASTDIEQVKAWWAAEPRANIGIPTGGAFDVVDVDGPQGSSSLIELEPIPSLARARTGRGLHIYVKPTGRGNGANLMPGIDYRGEGGYVIAPPSRHYRGERYYQWCEPPTALIDHIKECAQ